MKEAKRHVTQSPDTNYTNSIRRLDIELHNRVKDGDAAAEQWT
jgi:hypothetical protein